MINSTHNAEGVADLFQIDKFGRTPIYEQIIQQAERLIASGVWKPDDQIPSVRTMSQELSINPNTLQKAYAELERSGISYSVPGNGRFVSRDAPRIVGERMNLLLDCPIMEWWVDEYHKGASIVFGFA